MSLHKFCEDCWGEHVINDVLKDVPDGALNEGDDEALDGVGDATHQCAQDPAQGAQACTDNQSAGQIFRQAAERTFRQADGQIFRQADGQIFGQKAVYILGQSDRPEQTVCQLCRQFYSQLCRHLDSEQC